MKNPYAKFKNYREQAKHFEKLYLETNHELAHLKKQPATQFAPGHFYSPYPDLKEIEKRKNKIFDRTKKPIPGIDINEGGQLALLAELGQFYKDLPYKPKQKQTGWRYFFENDAYSYTDAIMLFCMLRKYQPKKVIEIGSGYSSALMMDVNEKFLDNKMDVTFVEPYPKLLLSLLRKNDKNYRLIDKNLSEVSNKVFESLGRGDILFVDSTHVSKAGSDVNQIFFDILPALKKGVIIHVHDVFYPFEYPHEWIKETRAWNEDYIVRAFLHNNQQYEILMFNHFMNIHHAKDLKQHLPLTASNAGGGLWLQKA